MKTRLSGAILLGAACLMTPGVAAQPTHDKTAGSRAQTDDASAKSISLAPVGGWKTIRRQGRCTIIRTFGEDEMATTLQLSLSGSQPFYNLTIIGDLVGSPFSHIVDIQFGPNEQASRRSYVTNRTRDGEPMMMMHGLLLAPVSAKEAEDGSVGRLDKARETAIDHVTFSRGVSRDFTLELGAMHAPLETLSTCAKDALGAYRGAPGQDGSSAKAATPSVNPGLWITPADYPRDLLGARMDGVVGFRTTVSKEGRAVYCQITSTNRPQMFDDTVCVAILRNARFNPALDAEGQPTVGFYSNQMRFQVR